MSMRPTAIPFAGACFGGVATGTQGPSTSLGMTGYGVAFDERAVRIPQICPGKWEQCTIPVFGVKRGILTEKKSKPPAADTWLHASVMAVFWAIVTSASWALLALGFGRSRGNTRLITMLIVSAVVVALVCAHAYRQGWEGRHNKRNS